MPKLKKILGVGVFFIAIVIALLYLFQERILFQPEKLTDEYVFEFDHPFTEFFLETEKGDRLNAIHFKNENPKGVILYFHGNKGSLRRWGKIASFFVDKDYDVIIMDYRGYGKSKGEITEIDLYNDAQLFYQYAKERYIEDVITIYGRSLGTGIATKIASQNQPCNLVLETPYYNLNDVAQYWVPYLPTHLLLRYKIPTAEFMNHVRCNVTIYHGTDDRVVPYQSGERLYKSISTPNKQLITIKGGSHNDLIEFEAYRTTIHHVLENSY